MTVILEELEAQALDLSVDERSELVRRLIVSLDGEPEGAPEEVARAWEEEIARRVAEIDARQMQLIRADAVFAEIDAIIAGQEEQR